MKRAVTTFLVAIAVMAVVFGSLFVSLRPGFHQESCKQRLKQISIALHQYHDKYSSFPPAYVKGPDGKPWHSWRVLLLPFLDEQPLYNQYHFDEPWDGPRNMRLSQSAPSCYRCPTSWATSETNYFAVVNRRTMWPEYFTTRLRDVHDGTTLTLHVVESVSQHVGWSEPRDLALKTALDDLSQSGPHQDLRHGLTVDGAVRRMRTIDRSMMLALLTPVANSSVIPLRRWPQDLLDVDEGPDISEEPVINTKDLKNVRVTPTRNASLKAEKSLVWCATFQMAWDKLNDEYSPPSHPLKFLTPTSLVDELNSNRFPKTSLAPECYELSIRPLANDEASKALDHELRRLNSISGEPASGPIGSVIRAVLHKQAPFEVAFDVFPTGSMFETGSVSMRAKSFGVPRHSSSSARTQVRVSRYVSPDDFAVEVQSISPQRDCIVLAKVPPSATLQQTWEFVRGRGSVKGAVIQSHPVKGSDTLTEEDHLAIPQIGIFVSEAFDDLINSQFTTGADDLQTIADAWQSIRFRLNEHGAELLSESEIAVLGEDEPPATPPKRDMIFNRPFLLAMQQANAGEPYFIAWIGSTDFLTEIKQP